MPRPGADAFAAAGFTLIEVVVALVILAAALFAFYDFLSSSLRAAAAAQRAANAYDRAENALELSTTLNPAESPEGTFDLGSYRIHWRAEQLEAPRQSTAYPSGKGRFVVALYRITFDFPGEGQFPPVEVTKLGYHLGTSPGTSSSDAAR
jgi:prepilin-type N-terminal cleavage/methylation domain-containing protein